MTLCTRTLNRETDEYEYHPFITGSVTIEEPVEATLAMTLETKNAVAEGNMYVVKEDKAIASIHVKNSGNTDYDNDVVVKMYKLVGTAGFLDRIGRKAVQVAAGASADVEIEFDDLLDRQLYFYNVYYLSNGKEVKGNSDPGFFMVHVNDTPTAVRALWDSENGPAQIFSPDGRKLADAQESDLVRVLDALPKGVYIIRVGRNSKIIRN